MKKKLSVSKQRKIEVSKLSGKLMKDLEQRDLRSLTNSTLIQYSHQSMAKLNPESPEFVVFVIRHLLTQNIPDKRELPTHWHNQQNLKFFNQLFEHYKSEIMRVYPFFQKDFSKVDFLLSREMWLNHKMY
jgi:hypothetical protein